MRDLVKLNNNIIPEYRAAASSSSDKRQRVGEIDEYRANHPDNTDNPKVWEIVKSKLPFPGKLITIDIDNETFFNRSPPSYTMIGDYVNYIGKIYQVVPLQFRHTQSNEFTVSLLYVTIGGLIYPEVAWLREKMIMNSYEKYKNIRARNPIEPRGFRTNLVKNHDTCIITQNRRPWKQSQKCMQNIMKLFDLNKNTFLMRGYSDYPKEV